MKHKRALVGALTLAVALGVGGAALPGSAAATTTAAVSAGHGSATDRARLQEILQRLTTVDGAPGALAEVRRGPARYGAVPRRTATGLAAFAEAGHRRIST